MAYETNNKSLDCETNNDVHLVQEMAYEVNTRSVRNSESKPEMVLISQISHAIGLIPQVLKIKIDNSPVTKIVFTLFITSFFNY